MADFTVQHVPQDEIVQVRFRGECDAEMLSMATAKLAEELTRCRCNRVLLDHRHASIRFSTLELLERPKIAATLGIDRSNRIAVIYPSARKGDYLFLETAGYNQGYSVKVFTDMDQGTEWLKSQ